MKRRPRPRYSSGGAPVVGQRGIEAEFAGKAVGYFQDLVTKLFAEQQDIAMATRGPVPGKSASKLHITNVVRGSFGFLLEEAEAQGSLIDTRLKAAVERATGLISAFGDANNEAFEEALTSVDERTLVSARSFFDLLKQDDATFRLVTGEFEATFGRDLIARAAERADASSLHETRDSLYGMLTGILPDHHSFEFRLTSDQTTISGKVVPTISSAELETMNRNLLFKEIRATFRVKRLLRKGALVRENYTLENVGPPELSMMNPVVTSR